MICSEQISKVESFIKNNKSGHLSMTYNNIYELKKIYDKIKDNPIGSYNIFACESYYSYALYKSMNGSFYVVSVFMQDFKEYEKFQLIMDRFNL